MENQTMSNNSTNSSNVNEFRIYMYSLRRPIDMSTTTFVTLLAVFVAFGFLIVVFNLATILTFVINRHLRRRSVYCLINLAVADMMYGAFCMADATNLLCIRSGLNGNILYGIFLSLKIYSMEISLSSLVVVSLERVYATLFPFRHRTTRLRTYFVVFAITWLNPAVLFSVFIIVAYSLVSRLGRLNFNGMTGSFWAGFFFLSLVIICVSYTAIFIKVKNQAQRLQPNPLQAAIQRTTQKRERHLAMTLFIVTLLSLATSSPIAIQAFIVNFNYHVFYFSWLIQLTNSLINPIVYVFRMRDFRKALSRLIFKCSRNQQLLHPIGNHGDGARITEPAIELGVI